jgi:hypothetical protein
LSLKINYIGNLVSKALTEAIYVDYASIQWSIRAPENDCNFHPPGWFWFLAMLDRRDEMDILITQFAFSTVSMISAVSTTEASAFETAGKGSAKFWQSEHLQLVEHVLPKATQSQYFFRQLEKEETG